MILALLQAAPTWGAYYGAKTVADINLEQIGGTDDTEGPRMKVVRLAGLDILATADVPAVPHLKEELPRTARYRKARGEG